MQNLLVHFEIEFSYRVRALRYRSCVLADIDVEQFVELLLYETLPLVDQHQTVAQQHKELSLLRQKSTTEKGRVGERKPAENYNECADHRTVACARAYDCVTVWNLRSVNRLRD